MELREVIGRRRSIRFLDPNRPVEMEKIQRMLEAARIASHWGNVQSLRAVVVMRDSAPQEVLDSMEALIVGWQLRIAPVIIVWYLETEAVDHQGDRLRELVNVGALGFGEEKHAGLEEQLIPFFDKVRPALKAPGLGEVDGGQGIAQATLMAFEDGLGTCCLGGKAEQIHKALNLPETARVLVVQTVGYPLENWEAGGQRPRLPFEELFQLNTYGEAFPRSEEVVDELTSDGMFTAPAPLPGREEELEELRQKLGLSGHGLI